MLKIANHSHYHKKLAREFVEQTREYVIEQDLLLHIEDTDITVCCNINKQKTCFSHSFIEPRLLSRAKQKNQSLLKACNNKRRELVSVVDLTAGWGKDSFILATHDQQVTMVEQNPFVFQCLDYLLKIAKNDQNDDLFERLNVINQNSLDFLSHHDQAAADCLYLDPMFPAHKSTAKPAKDLQILQILTINRDIEPIFDLALEKAGNRVVIKRPLHAPSLSDRKPDMVYREKTIRFDVYLTNNPRPDIETEKL